MAVCFLSWGFVQSLSAMLTAFLSAHAWALALVGNPCFVLFLPSGERYCTRHICQFFGAYFLIEAMQNCSLSVFVLLTPCPSFPAVLICSGG